MTKCIEMFKRTRHQIPPRGKVIVRDAFFGTELPYDWSHFGKVDVVNAGEQMVFNVVMDPTIHATQYLKIYII